MDQYIIEFRYTFKITETAKKGFFKGDFQGNNIINFSPPSRKYSWILI